MGDRQGNAAPLGPFFGKARITTGNVRCLFDISRCDWWRIKVSFEQCGPVARFVTTKHANSSPWMATTQWRCYASYVILRLKAHVGAAVGLFCFPSSIAVILYWSFCSLWSAVCICCTPNRRWHPVCRKSRKRLSDRRSGLVVTKCSVFVNWCLFQGTGALSSKVPDLCCCFVRCPCEMSEDRIIKQARL